MNATKIALSLGLSLALAGISAGSARAQQVRCGAMKVRWNAPQGAAVVTRHSGAHVSWSKGDKPDTTPEVVANVFDSAGHYWTHIMLSHGFDGDVSHASRANPKQLSDGDALIEGHALVAADLRAGMPGPSRINLAAAYAAEHGYDAAMVFPGGDKGKAVVSYLGDLDCDEMIDSDGTDTNSCRYLIPQRDGSKRAMPYSFLQFKDIGTNNLGIASKDGFACSTFVSWASANAVGNIIPVEVFDTDSVLTGLWAAYSATNRMCEELSDVAPPAICNGTGNQVAGCMAGVDDYSCGEDGPGWHDPGNWYNGPTARTISPDQVVNWSASTASNPSPWNPLNGHTDLPFPLEWSDDGEYIYGCWTDDKAIPKAAPAVTEIDEGELVPEDSSCDPVEITPRVPMIKAWHDPSNGADSEMDGNHPEIKAKVKVELRDGQIVATTMLEMMEAGDPSRSTFRQRPDGGVMTPINYHVPAACKVEAIKGIEHFDSVGNLYVEDAGVNNWSEETYAGDNVSGLISSAQCTSDTDGGIFGASDSGKIYCAFSLHPVELLLSPR